ncbi:MAG: hypothetical protein NXH78_16735 [Hyphomonadaceae bacterium]|nr:hypothetical protein [Hyphomonadaceae bacterium]
MKPHRYAGCALAIGLALAPLNADARPVSYPSGWTVMQMNNGDMSSAHIHYSPTFTDSIGLYSERNWGEDWHFTGVQYNRLVKRWNKPNSQANLYLKAAVGQADPFGDGADVEAAGFVGIGADWETRRWFASYEGRAYDLGFDQDARQSARIGVAPYIGDYGDLHTWLMLQVENQPEAETPTTLTPLVRFFYDVQLLEIGYTPETEELMLNWIVRF